METAAGVMNLVTAAVILVTGIYTQMALTSVLSPQIRAFIGLIAVIYFLAQVVKALRNNTESQGL